MQKIYGLTTGEYSDYTVLALFATEEQAKEALAQAQNDEELGWGNGDRVEEFNFYPVGVSPQKIKTYTMSASIWDDGRVTNERANEIVEWEFNQLWSCGPRPSVTWTRAPMYNGIGGRLDVRGTVKKAVEQAFSDHKAKRIANTDMGVK